MANAAGIDQAEIENFNLRRTAIQNTITWEFEMWRREVQAKWEQTLRTREGELRQRLEKELHAYVKSLDDDLDKAKQGLRAEQARLAELVAVATREAGALAKSKTAVADAKEKAKQNFEDAKEALQSALDKRRSLLLQKASAARAKAAEMSQRASYFREQWAHEEERLRVDVAAFDQKKREALTASDSSLRALVGDAALAISKLRQEIAGLETAKESIDEQLRRAYALETKLRARLGRYED